MADYRNQVAPIADHGLDLSHPPDKIPPGKWYQLTNAYPQVDEVISQRKGFSLFFDHGVAAGTIRTIFPVSKDVAFFFSSQGDPVNSIGITDSTVSNYQSLSHDWSRDPTFVGAQLPPSVPTSGSVPYTIPPAPGFGMNTQTWTFVSSDAKLRKFAYPPIDYGGIQFSEFAWGLQNPLTAPVVSLSGSAGGQDSSVAGAEPYVYVYTWYSSLTGAESIPSPESNSIDSTLQAIKVDGLTTYDSGPPFPSSDLIQYDFIRIYRKGGTQVSVFRLVGTVASGITSIEDNQSDDTLSTSLELNEDNFRPFVTKSNTGQTLYGTPLPYIWGPFLGQFIFACGDLVQPGTLFWTNQGRPDTMDPDNNITITSAQESLMNGFLYASNSFVFSQQRLFAIDYGGPTAIPTFTPREIPINMGLACPFGLTVSSLGGVFFVGADGIYVTDCQGTVESITQDSLKPIFRGEDANGFLPVELLDSSGNPSKDVKLFSSGQELHFLYTTSAEAVTDRPQHLVYNILGKSWRKFELGISGKHITAGTPVGGSEAKFLVGTEDAGTINFHSLILAYDNNDEDSPITDNGNFFTVSCTTGGYDMQLPQTLKEFGNVLIDADAQGGLGITVTPIFDGIAGTPQVITGTSGGRLKYPLSLNDTYAYFAQLKFEWPSTYSSPGLIKIFGAEFLFRTDQEVLKHWETPPAAFGNAGWQHIRDGYFCLRSTSDITLTILIDGVSYTYVIPSTGGAKEKVYMKFRPVKGKMFGFALDAQGSGVFRMYGEDTQLNIKPWNTDFGYKPIYPFIAPGLAPFLRKEAGT